MAERTKKRSSSGSIPTAIRFQDLLSSGDDGFELETQQEKVAVHIVEEKSRRASLVRSHSSSVSASPSDSLSQSLPTDLCVSYEEKKTAIKSLSEKASKPKEPSEMLCETSLTQKELLLRLRALPFTEFHLAVIAVFSILTLLLPSFLSGLFWGAYLSFVAALLCFISAPQTKPIALEEPAQQANGDQKSASEHVEMAVEATEITSMPEDVVYKGWMNILRNGYSADTYHVNSTQSVLVRLEGSTLRISRPTKAGMKHAFHTDPTLTQSMPSIASQTLYDLTGCKVDLRPKKLAPRRWWSRKYPIHIQLAPGAAIFGHADGPSSMSRSVSLQQYSQSDNPNGTTVTESESSSDDEGSIQLPVSRSSSTSDFASNLFKAKKHTRSLYLFARAAREKERWFHLLREASFKEQASSAHSDSSSSTHRETDDASLKTTCSESALYRMNHVDFSKQLTSIVGCTIATPEPGSTVSLDLGSLKWQRGSAEDSSELVSSVHAIAVRMFYDFCRDKYWEKCVTGKIQAKLSSIHLPQYIEPLELSSLDLGTVTPRIVGVYSPKCDDWGLWVDFELRYSGSIHLVIQTAVNLTRLQSGPLSTSMDETTASVCSARSSNHADPDLPESPESSADEDFGATNSESNPTKEKTGKRIIAMFERYASTPIVQKALRIPKISKIIEEVSTTPLILNVTVEIVEGTMTVNFPPPPSDRLWYAFRKPPTLSIKAVPQVGDRSIDLTSISDWIENKLRLLVEKNLVIPNMDDVVLPVMSGNALLTALFKT